MNKLEQKLIELGYKYDLSHYVYTKEYQLDTDNKIMIVLNSDRTTIQNSRVYCLSPYFKQQDIDNLQLAYNEMQKDLEVLKEYENN